MVQTSRNMHGTMIMHVIDFDNAKFIDIGNFRSRLTLESWHTAKDRNADNNSKPLPQQYTVLIKKT